MNALMLIFALSASGQSGTMAIRFESTQACEAARFDALRTVVAMPTADGAPITHVAAVCVKPVQADKV